MRGAWSTLGGRTAVLVLLGAGVAWADDSPPSFETSSAAITVDVVVVDKAGSPVRDLSRDEVTVYEDGAPQRIVGFEPRHLPLAEDRAPSDDQAMEDLAASNDRAPERVFAVVVDDLGLSPLVAEQVRGAVAAWITQARPADEITLATTSGETWWSDVVGRGREDLLDALDRIRGRAAFSSGGDAMSDWEAYRIAAFEQSTEGIVDPAERSRTPNFVGAQQRGADGMMYYVQRLTGHTMVDRVAQRWLDESVCDRCVDPAEMSLDCKEVRVCRARVQSRANEIYDSWVRRTTALYQTLAQLSEGLAAAPGRKAIVLISEELFEDSRLNVSSGAIDAAQRANAAIYFLGARGLSTTSLFSAASKTAARAQDMAAISIEQGVLATAAGVALAEDTGGVAVTTANDLLAGLERITTDASSYYLVGYQPRAVLDGKWHTLKVEVGRPDVEVRARRRYLAHKAAAPVVNEAREPSSPMPTRSTKREVAPSLWAGASRTGLPLRLAALVQEPGSDGLVRVQVVLEIDNGQVAVDRSGVPWRASLDLTIMAASPGRPPVVPIDERLDLSLDATQVSSGWWLIPRDIWLPPGVTQVRVHVRDVASGTAGLVTDRIVVPPLDQAYLSTPVLTDRTLPASTPSEPARLVPTAARVFGQHPDLYCQFETFLYGAWNLRDASRLVASHTLERADGSTVSSDGPTPVEIDDQRAIRRITLPLHQLDPGPYRLVLSVKDLVTQRTLETQRSFVVAPRVAANAVP